MVLVRLPPKPLTTEFLAGASTASRLRFCGRAIGVSVVLRNVTGWNSGRRFPQETPHVQPRPDRYPEAGRDRLVPRHLRTAVYLGLAIGALSCAPPGTEGPDGGARAASDAPACPECTIELDPIVVLGLRDTLLPDWPQAVVVDSRDHYYLAVPNRQEMPLVFGPDGGFRARIGKPGDGPGELRLASFLAVGAGDTLYVHDRASRLVVFGPDGGFVRQAPFPASGWGIEYLGNGTILLNATVFETGAVGRPFHQFSQQGTFLSSFGDSIGGPRQSPGFRAIHRIWSDGEGGFWAARAFGNYLLEHWRAAALLNRLQVERPWFVAAPSGVESPDLDALDQVVGGSVDSAGRLWVYLNVADPMRRTAGTEAATSPEGTVRIPTNWDAYFDTVIEAFDVGTGRLLASRRLDERFRHALGGDRLARVAEDEQGRIIVSVFRVRLVEP
jgi:hypothetical protein